MPNSLPNEVPLLAQIARTLGASEAEIAGQTEVTLYRLWLMGAAPLYGSIVTAQQASTFPTEVYLLREIARVMGVPAANISGQTEVPLLALIAAKLGVPQFSIAGQDEVPLLALIYNMMAGVPTPTPPPAPPPGFVEIYSGGSAIPAAWSGVPDTLFYDGTSVWADPATTVIETTHNGDLDGAINLTSLLALTNFVCGANLITSINALNLTNLEELAAEDNALTSLNIVGCTTLLTINAQANALPQAQVDGALDAMADLTTEDGTLNLQDGTNAAPSAAGDTDKTTLEGRGWAVAVN